MSIHYVVGMVWITSPSWRYRVTEGIHVMLGLALVPVVLAKLWSVIPKLFVRPPWRSDASLLERLKSLSSFPISFHQTPAARREFHTMCERE